MLIVIYTVCFMDYKNPLQKKVEWKRIREAVCNLVSYDLSYKKRLGVFMLDKWIEIYNSQLKYKGIK